VCTAVSAARVLADCNPAVMCVAAARQAALLNAAHGHKRAAKYMCGHREDRHDRRGLTGRRDELMAAVSHPTVTPAPDWLRSMPYRYRLRSCFLLSI
jgi:hypothetical protein